MLKKRIIPCLDIKDGRVVKGENFVNIKDAGDPLVLAKFYDKNMADELVLLDITASSDGRGTMIDLVRRVAKEVYIPFTVGGGIKSLEDVTNILRAGADKISICSPAIKDPTLITKGAQGFGSQCICVAIDCQRKSDGTYEIYSNGGRVPMGIDALYWAQKVESLGAGEILLTSMDKDGTKDGFENNITKLISEKVNIPVIASGGAGSLAHFKDVFTETKASAALAASIFHYGDIPISEVKKYLKEEGIDVRC